MFGRKKGTIGALSNFGDPYWFITTPMAIIGWVIALVGSILNNAGDSSRFPVFSWWGLAFEAVVIAVAMFSVYTNRIREYRFALLTLLAVATVYTTNSTNNFVWRNNVTSGATAAGNILMSIINFFWILYLGTSHDEPVHAYIESFAGSKKPERSFNMRKSQIPTTPGNNNSHFGEPRVQSPQRMEPSQVYSVEQLQRHGLSRGGSPGYTTRPDMASALAPSAFPASVPSTVQSPTSLIGGMGESSANHTRLSHSPSSNPLDDTEEHEGFLGSHQASDTEISDDDPGSEYPWRARAKFSYNASIHDGELSFERGEILQVKDMRNKWWLCRRANGEVGICPNNYLELLDDDDMGQTIAA